MNNMRVLISLLLGLTTLLLNAHAQDDTADANPSTKFSSDSSTTTIHGSNWIDGSPFNDWPTLSPLSPSSTTTTHGSNWIDGSPFNDWPTFSPLSQSSITAKSSSDTSSSSASVASGFWSGTDPFSFVWPSSITASLGERPTFSASTTKSSASSSSANSSISASQASSASPSIATQDPSSSASSTPALSTSTSIQVTWVTASPVSPPDAASSESHTSTVSSPATKYTVVNGILIGYVLGLLGRWYW